MPRHVQKLSEKDTLDKLRATLQANFRSKGSSNRGIVLSRPFLWPPGKSGDRDMLCWVKFFVPSLGETETSVGSWTLYNVGGEAASFELWYDHDIMVKPQFPLPPGPMSDVAYCLQEDQTSVPHQIWGIYAVQRFAAGAKAATVTGCKTGCDSDTGCKTGCGTVTGCETGCDTDTGCKTGTGEVPLEDYIRAKLVEATETLERLEVVFKARVDVRVSGIAHLLYLVVQWRFAGVTEKGVDEKLKDLHRESMLTFLAYDFLERQNLPFPEQSLQIEQTCMELREILESKQLGDLFSALQAVFPKEAPKVHRWLKSSFAADEDDPKVDGDGNRRPTWYELQMGKLSKELRETWLLKLQSEHPFWMNTYAQSVFFGRLLNPRCGLHCLLQRYFLPGTKFFSSFFAKSPDPDSSASPDPDSSAYDLENHRIWVGPLKEFEEGVAVLIDTMTGDLVGTLNVKGRWVFPNCSDNATEVLDVVPVPEEFQQFCKTETCVVARIA